MNLKKIIYILFSLLIGFVLYCVTYAEYEYEFRLNMIENALKAIASFSTIGAYFTTFVYDLTESMTLDYSELDSFVILICLEGACVLKDNEGYKVRVQAGETILFPATTQEVNVCTVGHVKFLETYV